MMRRGQVILSAVRRLVVGGADVNAKDGDGWTALMVAANRGFEDMVRCLVESGGVVDEEAAFWAALWGHDEVVKYLESILFKEE